MADEYREQLSLDVSKFLSGLKQAQQGLADFGSKGKSALSGASDILGVMAARLAPIGGMFVGLASAAIAAGFAIAKSAGNAAEELQQLEIQTGLSTDQLQNWTVAMRRVGLDTGDLAFMMRILSQNIVEARDSSSNAARMFDTLGISKKALASGDTNAILQEMAVQFSKMENGADKSRLAIELLGRGGLTALPVFEQNLKKAAEESKRFGKLSEDQIAQLGRMDDAFDDLGTAIKKAKDLLGADLAPAVEESVRAITELVVIVKDLFTGKDSLLTKVANGVSFAFIQMMSTIKAAIAYVKLSREEYLKELDKIDKDAATRIARLYNPKGADSKGDRNKVTIPEDPSKAREEAVKLLDAQYKLRQAQEQLGEQRLADTAAHDRAGLARQVANREVFGAEIVEIEKNIALRELEGKLNLIQQMQGADQEYFGFRMRIGFKNEAAQQEFVDQAATIKINRDKQVAALESKLDTERYNKRTEVIKAIDAEEQKSGEHKRDMAISQYNTFRNLQLQELQGRVALAQANVDAGEAELATYEEMARRRLLLMEQQRDLELLQHEGSEAQKLAITERYHALMAREERRINNGFLQGILEGVHSYTTNINSMFGMAVDMARQSAQAMQGAFRQFFFDMFEGKIRTVKDALKGMFDFVKQVASQVAAQLMTIWMLKMLVGGFAGGAGGGGGAAPVDASAGMLANQGGQIQRFSMGGPVFSNGDSVPAMLTPGEFVVFRKGVDALNKINQGQVPMGHEGNVTVNVVNSGNREKPKVDVRKQLEGMVIDIIYRNVNGNGPLRDLVGG